MTHDEQCEEQWSKEGGWTPPCGCADRAIAAARREGRIEGACCAINDLMDWSEDHVIAQAQDCVYNRWPEDKP